MPRSTPFPPPPPSPFLLPPFHPRTSSGPSIPLLEVAFLMAIALPWQSRFPGPRQQWAGFHGCWKHRINIVPLTWKDFAAALFNYDRFVGPPSPFQLLALAITVGHRIRGEDGYGGEEDERGGGDSGCSRQVRGRRVFHGENFWCGWWLIEGVGMMDRRWKVSLRRRRSITREGERSVRGRFFSSFRRFYC